MRKVPQRLEKEDLEFLDTTENQSERGQFITPPEVADRLAQDLSELSLNPIKEVHDLGCGPGALSSAVRRMDSTIRVIGYDIHEEAVAKFNSRFPEHGRAYHRDILLDPKIPNMTAAISNPPHLLSRRIGDSRTAEILETGYFKSVSGKLNTFSLFMEIALRELADGGVAAFIIPIAITNLDDHKGIRSLLFEECEEIRITWKTDSNPFKDQGVAVETCIVSFRKGGGEKSLEIREWDGSEITRRREIKQTESDTFPTIDAVDLPEQQGAEISSMCDIVASGFNWSQNWEEIAGSAPPAEYQQGMLPVVAGRNLSKDGNLTTDISINYQYLRENGGIVRGCDFDNHSTNRPRLIICDIGTSTIKVAYTESPCLPMNSVKVIFHKGDDKKALMELRDYLMTEDALIRLKISDPNLHLTKANLGSLRVPVWGDAE